MKLISIVRTVIILLLLLMLAGIVDGFVPDVNNFANSKGNYFVNYTWTEPAYGNGVGNASTFLIGEGGNSWSGGTFENTVIRGDNNLTFDIAVTGYSSWWDMRTNNTSRTTLFDVNRTSALDGTLTNVIWNSSGGADFNGVSSYIDMVFTSINPGAYPFTMVYMAKANKSTSGVIASIVDTTSSTKLYGFDVFSNKTRLAASSSYFISSTDNTTNYTHTGIGVWKNATYRELYINGVSNASGTSSYSYDSGFNRISIGRFGDATPGSYFSKTIYDVLFYPRQLNSTEISSLTGMDKYQTSANYTYTYDAGVGNETYQVDVNLSNTATCDILYASGSSNSFTILNSSISGTTSSPIPPDSVKYKNTKIRLACTGDGNQNIEVSNIKFYTSASNANKIDEYRVYNGTWTNGSTNLYFTDSVGENNISTVTIYGYNNSFGLSEGIDGSEYAPGTPTSITGLGSTNTASSITFSWTNPIHINYNHTEVYINGTFQGNYSNTSLVESGLTPNNRRQISTRTADAYGNVNQTFVNWTDYALVSSSHVSYDAGKPQIAVLNYTYVHNMTELYGALVSQQNESWVQENQLNESSSKIWGVKSQFSLAGTLIYGLFYINNTDTEQLRLGVGYQSNLFYGQNTSIDNTSIMGWNLTSNSYAYEGQKQIINLYGNLTDVNLYALNQIAYGDFAGGTKLSNKTIQNVTIQYGNKAFSNSYCDYCILDNITIKDGDRISNFANGFEASVFTNSTITNINITNLSWAAWSGSTGAYGMQITPTNSIIHDINIFQTAYSGMNLGGNNATIYNISITNASHVGMEIQSSNTTFTNVIVHVNSSGTNTMHTNGGQDFKMYDFITLPSEGTGLGFVSAVPASNINSKNIWFENGTFNDGAQIGSGINIIFKNVTFIGTSGTVPLQLTYTGTKLAYSNTTDNKIIDSKFTNNGTVNFTGSFGINNKFINTNISNYNTASATGENSWTNNYYAGIHVQDNLGNPLESTVIFSNVENVSIMYMSLDNLGTTSTNLISSLDGYGENQSTFYTDFNGNTSLPDTNRSNSPVVANYTTNTSGTTFLTWEVCINKVGYIENCTIISPDSSWYRSNPNTYQNTTTIILQSEQDYIPPSPTELTNTSGNFWVNYTWQPGSGNVTDSYNITLINNSITYYINGSSQNWINSTLNASEWSNIIVYAYNNSGTGTLNTTGISQNTQALVPTIPLISNVVYASLTLTSYYVDWDVNQTADNWVVYYNSSTNNDSAYCDGVWDGTNICANSYDRNWSTYAESAGALTSNVYFNYTIPANANQTESLWHIKDAGAETNLTVPAACWNTPMQLRAKGTDISNNVVWYCHNGVDWTTLRTNSSANLIYEQEMIYKYTSLWDNNTNAPNITISNLAEGTIYYFNAWSYNSSDILYNNSSDTYSFTTGFSHYIPPAPIYLAETNGSFWVNYTWAPGIGNITDSYNVSQNNSWVNGTITLYNNSSVGGSGWSNITVCAYNNSGIGYLSSCVSQNTQAPSAFTPSNNVISCPVGWCYLAMNRTNYTLSQLDSLFTTDIVQGWWNASTQKFESHSFFSSNQNVNVTQKSGYYYYFLSPTTVYVNITENPTITLKLGWNLVGNMDTNRTILELETSIGGTVVTSSHWNNTEQQYQNDAGEIVHVGESFLVNVNADTSWSG